MKEVHPMKFFVEVARALAVGHESTLTRKKEFVHAVDAYKFRDEYLSRKKDDPRLISVKIIPVKG